MKRIVSVLMVLVLLFAFVACNSEAGGQSGGGSGEMSPAEQAILNKYGEDIFYFAELADMAASVGEPMEEICGAANDSARASVVSMYSAFGIQISNTSATTASFTWTEDGVTVTIDASNVSIVPTKGLNDSMSYDAAVTVSGKENHSATVSLELDLVNNTTTITTGKYKTSTFGTGSNDLKKANDCLKEIEALDDEGNGNNGGQNPYNPGQGQGGGGGGSQEPGQTQTWDGKDSIPYNGETVLQYLRMGIYKYQIKYVEYELAGDTRQYYEYTYGQYGGDFVWATRRDYVDPSIDPEFEPQFDGCGMDKDTSHQVYLENEDDTSDYLVFETNQDTGEWGFDMGFTYDEDEDWDDAYGVWIDDDIFQQLSDLLYPYSAIGQYYNGQYKKLTKTATICGRACDIYQYMNDFLYIDSEGLCLRWTMLDNSQKEQIYFTVTEFDTNISDPPFTTIPLPNIGD